MKLSMRFLDIFVLIITCALSLPIFSDILPAESDTVPAIETWSLEGVRVSFRPPEGKILMMLFWDTHSWSADRTAAWALDLYRQYHEKGLEVLGVCTDSLEDEVMEYSERWKIPWPQVSNTDSPGVKRTDEFNIARIPAAIVVDSQGNVLAHEWILDKTGEILAKLLGSDEGLSPGSSTGVLLSKRDWGAEQVVGSPDTSEAGDFASAWASATPDGQEEWLVLHYDKPVIPQAVHVYESNHPGAVCRVSVFTAEGREMNVWSGEDPTPESESCGVSEIPLRLDYPIDTVKIVIDSMNHEGCNAIDAVGLVDEAGKTHWAVDAQASSSFADAIQCDSDNNGYLYPTDRSLVSFDRLTGSQEAVSEMKRTAHAAVGAEQSYRYHIKAFIDGASVLAIHRNTARWYHPKPALAGLQSDNIFPTYINGREWFPQWEDETRSGWSSLETGLDPALPGKAVQVSLKNPKVEATNCGCEMNDKTFGFSGMIGQAPKGAIYILQHPSAENDYVLAIAFDDFGLGGSNIYDCYVNVRISEREMNGSLAHSGSL